MQIQLGEKISSKIYEIRGVKVMLGVDLALLYQIENKRLNEQVKRNIDRFPDDFMFVLTNVEFIKLRSQFATAKFTMTRSNPFAFTEHGILMLSSILNSKKAIDVNINIMRTFTKMREFALNYEEVIKRLEINENETKENKALIKKAFDYLELILNETKQTDKNLIGFVQN